MLSLHLRLSNNSCSPASEGLKVTFRKRSELGGTVNNCVFREKFGSTRPVTETYERKIKLIKNNGNKTKCLTIASSSPSLYKVTYLSFLLLTAVGGKKMLGPERETTRAAPRACPFPFRTASF